ncbi:hypothetical protein HJC23_009300 [Cyclotella cryptica]|uniref:Peptidase M24 domain-containing protein n=1 Tax=Cyclotella cryptica TaxID=29204 RepID=A0ABD3QW89_9STRA
MNSKHWQFVFGKTFSLDISRSLSRPGNDFNDGVEDDVGLDRTPSGVLSSIVHSTLNESSLVEVVWTKPTATILPQLSCARNHPTIEGGRVEWGACLDLRFERVVESDRAALYAELLMETDEIDRIVHEATIVDSTYPSPLNCHNFSKSCGTSIGEDIFHRIPDTRPLQLGGIINLDITLYLNGYHGDCYEMFVVGGESAADESTRKVLQSTYDCWIKAMNFVQPGKDYKEIGAIIEDHVTSRGLTTVKSFCGHIIGPVFHTNPNKLHYRNNEPTATTLDGKRSEQFEHKLWITEDGVEALTGKIKMSLVQFWERESEVHRGVWLGSSGAKERESVLNSLLLGEATQV